jgi:hypothetical protein
MSSDKCSSLLVERQSGDASGVVLEVRAVGIRNTRSLDASGTDGFEDGELSVIRAEVCGHMKDSLLMSEVAPTRISVEKLLTHPA